MYDLVQAPQAQTVDYYRAVQGSLTSLKESSISQAVASVGQVVVQTTPIAMAARLLRKNSMGGLGQSEDPGLSSRSEAMAKLGEMGAAALVVAGVLVLVTGALSYQAGKAMAPNSGDRKTWGWVGVPVGVFTGPWGLGIMGIVSNSKKGG